MRKNFTNDTAGGVDSAVGRIRSKGSVSRKLYDYSKIRFSNVSKNTSAVGTNGITSFSVTTFQSS